MGRKTFESIGRPLPGRDNIVVTRDPAYRADGVQIVHSLEEAITATRNAEEAMVIGGAQLYAEALPKAERMYLTLIDTDFSGDAYFPEYATNEWRETAREECAPRLDEPGSYPYCFVMLQRL